MSLSNYQAPKLVVSFKGGQFEVRGITLDDLAILLKNHLNDIENLVDMFQKEPDHEAAVASLLKHSITLIREAPGLVANLIALASDEPDAVDNARSLSMPIQVKAIQSIAQLSFEEAGGPKKFVESLWMLLKGMPSLTKTDSLT